MTAMVVPTNWQGLRVLRLPPLVAFARSSTTNISSEKAFAADRHRVA